MIRLVQARTIFRDELNRARKRLALGASLRKAAEAIDAEPGELDVALWNALGRRP